MRLRSYILLVSGTLMFAPAYAKNDKVVREFAGLRLDQSIAESTEFFLKKDFRIVADGSTLSKSGVEKVRTSNEQEAKKALEDASKNGKVCAATRETVETDLAKIMVIQCGRLKNVKGDDPVRAYVIKHIVDSEPTKPSAYSMSFYFTLEKQKEIGTGLIGKLGSAYSVYPDKKCDSDLVQNLKIKEADWSKCYTAIWSDEKTFAVAQGFGSDLERGIVNRLDIWDESGLRRANLILSKDKESTAKKLGF